MQQRIDLTCFDLIQDLSLSAKRGICTNWNGIRLLHKYICSLAIPGLLQIQKCIWDLKDINRCCGKSNCPCVVIDLGPVTCHNV